MLPGVNLKRCLGKRLSWASIDADLLKTRWDKLLTDVKTDEMYKIIINICLEIWKKHVLPKKSQRKRPKHRDMQKGFDEKKIKIAKENAEVNKSSNQRKRTKSDQRN